MKYSVTVGIISVLATSLTVAVGAETPGTVTQWKPPGIASPEFESHAAFDPRTGDLYFVRSSPQFEGWRILTSQCTPQGWSEPRSPQFAGDGVEADPWFTVDGDTVYFISTRSTDGTKRADLDIWQASRTPQGQWREPKRLPAPVNSTGKEWFPRLAPDGTLYFGSDRPGGLGKTDIWHAKLVSGKWVVENMGSAINTPNDEYEPLPSASGESMIIMGHDGFYESRRSGTTWSPRTKLGPPVNVNGTEIGALLSPSGRSMLFSRDTKGPESGEFFVWRMSGTEAWPDTCARK